MIPVRLLGEGQLTQMKTYPNKKFPEPPRWLLLTTIKPGTGYGEKGTVMLMAPVHAANWKKYQLPLGAQDL